MDFSGGVTLNKIVLLFHEGGVEVMSGITLTLGIAIIIVVERAIRLWNSYSMKADSTSFMSSIQKAIMNNSIESAIRACKGHKPSLLAMVLAEGLKRSNNSTEEIENALDHALLKANPQVKGWAPFLGTLANVATLLGLLGTLFGLMKSFKGAAEATGAAKATILAAGISEALVATSYGLSTALFCLFSYGILSMKQSDITDEINRNAAKLLDLLYTRKMKLKGTRK
jgi:biopolymer transport protein ExbB